MSENGKLLAALEQLDADRQDYVMATVTGVEGSAYRRPGARMLISSHGVTVGTVSGGCLEGELARRAWWLTESGAPVVRSYQTGLKDGDADEEEALAFGLGCNGTVHILLERVTVGEAYLPVRLMRQVRKTGVPSIMATVTRGHVGSFGIGSRASFDSLATVLPRDVPAALREQLELDLRAAFSRGRTLSQSYKVADEECEVLFEYMAPPHRLVIFGAGHDAQPLVDIAAHLGWQVAVIDARRHFAVRERFPNADQVMHVGQDCELDLSSLLDGAAAVVMTHSLSQDRHWLAESLRHQCFYVGQLGPRERTERLLLEMGAPAVCADQLHFPVGLDIGAESPEGVALSIMAEVTACLNHREGHSLRMRNTAIHEPLMSLRST
ncbi:putative xanthine dehydrogenase subunit A [compost metagenome]